MYRDPLGIVSQQILSVLEAHTGRQKPPPKRVLEIVITQNALGGGIKVYLSQSPRRLIARSSDELIVAQTSSPSDRRKHGQRVAFGQDTGVAISSFDVNGNALDSSYHNGSGVPPPFLRPRTSLTMAA